MTQRKPILGILVLDNKRSADIREKQKHQSEIIQFADELTLRGNKSFRGQKETKIIPKFYMHIQKGIAAF